MVQSKERQLQKEGEVGRKGKRRTSRRQRRTSLWGQQIMATVNTGCQCLQGASRSGRDLQGLVLRPATRHFASEAVDGSAVLCTHTILKRTGYGQKGGPAL